MAYILGHKEFYGLDFKVTKDTLIPRPETEHLVEVVTGNLKLVNRKKNNKVTILDIGTGSGNIIISVAKELKNSKLPFTNYQLLATDISKKALRVARHNAKKHNVNEQIKFLKGSLLSPILNTKYLPRRQAGKTQNAIIVANLPYLSQKIYEGTMPDVKNFEPRSALLSENNGLAHYEKLFNQIRKLLLFVDHCLLIIEFSPEQKPALQKLIEYHFPAWRPKFQKDLAGKWRVCQISP